MAFLSPLLIRVWLSVSSCEEGSLRFPPSVLSCPVVSHEQQLEKMLLETCSIVYVYAMT